MDLIREKVFVNRYHYDVRNHEWEKENGVPKTNVEVTFQLHNKDEEANNTSVVAVLQFMIVRDEFVISGIVSQMDHIQNRIVNEPKDFSQEEAEALAAPLLDTLQRLTYEVTEIAWIVQVSIWSSKMSLAVITDSSVNLPAEIQGHADVYVLDIPVIIEGQPFVEGKNLDVNQFYAQMANSEELLKTSQPNLADLDNLLTELEEKGYTHVIGLFLSSGISGFWANSQILIEDHAKLKITFPDTKITAAPMGAMVRNVLHWSAQGMSFENI